MKQSYQFIEDSVLRALRFISLTGVSVPEIVVKSLPPNLSDKQRKAVIKSFAEQRLVTDTKLDSRLYDNNTMILRLNSAGWSKIEKANSSGGGGGGFFGASPYRYKEIESVLSDPAVLRRKLQIAESLSVWNKKYEVISFFFTDVFNKSRIVCQIHNFFEKYRYETADVFGFEEQISGILFGIDRDMREDYIVVLKHWWTGAIRVERCRIATRQNLNRILAGDNRIFWITTSEKQARAIGQNPDIQSIPLRSVAEPEDQIRQKNIDLELTGKLPRRSGNKSISVNEERTFNEERVLNILKKIKLPLCARQVTSIGFHKLELGRGYKIANQTLNNLTVRGKLQIKEGKLSYFYNSGRPEKYFYLLGQEKFFVEKCFQRQIILSELCSRLIHLGWIPLGTNPELPFIVMAPKTAKENRVVFLSDHADREHNDSVDSTVQKFLNVKFTGKYLKCLVTYDINRYDKIIKKVSDRLVFNLAGKLYREDLERLISN